MPIIASATIPINVKEDHTIELLFLEELSRKRCINIQAYATVNNEKKQLYDVVKKLVGEQVIECTEDTCCIAENYYDLVSKIKGLQK